MYYQCPHGKLIGCEGDQLELCDLCPRQREKRVVQAAATLQKSEVQRRLLAAVLAEGARLPAQLLPRKRRYEEL